MWSFFTGATKRAENDEGRLASSTNLGWVLSSPVSGERKKPRLSSVNFVSIHVLKVATQTQHEGSGTEELLHRLWDLDSIVIRDKETVHDKFLENISFTNGRYCVTLPLKEKRDPLPDNYELGLVRLNSLEKAFLNIEVDKQQRDLMRFLWIDDINSEDPNIVTYRFCRVIFSMNCSPSIMRLNPLQHRTP